MFAGETSQEHSCSQRSSSSSTGYVIDRILNIHNSVIVASMCTRNIHDIMDNSDNGGDTGLLAKLSLHSIYHSIHNYQ